MLQVCSENLLGRDVCGGGGRFQKVSFVTDGWLILHYSQSLRQIFSHDGQHYTVAKEKLLENMRFRVLKNKNLSMSSTLNVFLVLQLYKIKFVSGRTKERKLLLSLIFRKLFDIWVGTFKKQCRHFLDWKQQSLQKSHTSLHVLGKQFSSILKRLLLSQITSSLGSKAARDYSTV